MKKMAYMFFLLTCLFSFGAVVHADNALPFDPPTMEDGEGNEIEKPNAGNNINESGEVDTDFKSENERKYGDKDSRYDYMYTSYLDTDNPIKTVTNNMVQGVFYFAKLLYRMTDWISSLLDKFNIVDTYADKVFSNGKTIYLDFFNVKNPLIYLIALGILWLLVKAYFKGNLARTLGSIALILMFNIGYFTLGTKALKQINVQSDNIVTKVVNQIKIDGVSSDVGDSFEIMVKKPFRDMNFENESQYGANEKNLNGLVNSDNDAGKVTDVRKESKSELLTGNLFGTKFTAAFGAVVNNLVFSFVILAFKVIVVFVKTLLLVLFTIAPFVAFVSFFEFCQMAMKNLVLKTGMLAALASILGGGTTLFITLNNILDKAIGGGDTNPLFLALAKIIIYVLLWKNKGIIASVFQANISKLGNNRVVQGMNRAFGQAKQKAVAPVQQLALAGGYSAGQGIKSLDNKVGRSALRNHGNQKRLGKYKNSLNTLADPTKDEKERKKAEKSKQRFEKRLAKNDKKQENPYISKKKNNKLDQEKKANMPVSDSKKAKPSTPEGQELKQLQDKAKRAEQVKTSAERFKQNTASSYEGAKQRTTKEDLDKKVMDKTKAQIQEKKKKKEVVSRFVANRQAQIREKEANKRKEKKKKNTQNKYFKSEKENLKEKYQ
ncbi:TrbL/VirB6 family protein, partial [Lactococcus garvieae]